MTGQITHLVDDQQSGTIAGDDGIDYRFHRGGLLAIPFHLLQVGAHVSFLPSATTQRATAVQIVDPDVERLR